MSGGGRTHVVLIVDDHADTRELYMQVLDLGGYAAHGAADGFEAWGKANDLLPDVIITDIGLPKMDGLELCGRLKANRATAHIPVLALTGFGEASVAERARALGIAKILMKPCPAEVLLAEVHALVASPPDGPFER